MTQSREAETSDAEWKSLYRVGGAAALIAGALFRRNIGAEVALFGAQAQPDTIGDWFTLLQNNRLLGLSYLNVFDLVNYTLVSLMFLALYAALKRPHKSSMVIATALGLVGIAVTFASNAAFSMLALGDQYMAATTEAQRTMSLAAGQALLALHRFGSPGAHPGTGGYMSLLLIAMAGMITSSVMLRSTVFNRATAYVGILASAFDLAYCIAFVFVPAVDGELLALCCIPAGGLFLMLWHIMVGWRLYQLGRIKAEKLPGQ